jgi:Uncharacterized conserved protein
VGEILVVISNRLSDYFFVLSRYLSRKKGEDEILWDRNK